MAEFLEDEFFSIDQMLIDESNMEDSQASAMEGTEYNDNNVVHEEAMQQPKGRKQLTVSQKRELVDAFLLKQEGGTLPRGYLSQQARKFNVHRSTIQRLFTDIKSQMAVGNVIDVRSKKLGIVGRKPTEYTDEFLQSVPLYKRTTERSYGAALNISHVTIHKLKKKGRLRTHTSTNHPALTSNHKIARFKWVLSHLLPAAENGDPKFEDMQQVVHIDEKWFYLNPETRRFYLLPNEPNPYRCQQSKRFKVKGMFMTVIGKPIFDTHGLVVHDGKYGIFPFVYDSTAKKKSKNREAGTVEIKAIQNVNKEAIRAMLLNNVIPAIKSKWPPHLSKDIWIQWDNARPHQIPKDEEFIAACQSHGFKIQFIYQPAQSPDLNVLDLGLFNVIQPIQYQSFPKNLGELIDKVKEAYELFDPVLNKHYWITLQCCMEEILKNLGGNNFTPPHKGKKRQDRLGMLSEQLQVDKNVVQQSVDYLNTLFISTGEGNEEDEGMQVDAD
ncbi:uncharacterized protein LOC110717965 [Chenopodium quinoa]|uniref:uncharacterized protein LOC110717965 n=1 Tax=Chenopodium quinoa TaxID=63459 RepID=UPI000B77AF18|nr:uncharacterized protein LOC110717965 [Chenopodium quinoa]